jgi:hypothetical protein
LITLDPAFNPITPLEPLLQAFSPEYKSPSLSL